MAQLMFAQRKQILSLENTKKTSNRPRGRLLTRGP